ncbi:MAG: hypothetical protein GF333_02295 [Candidatus Omnitrophica bacterium]|nr:hypothetical protein [Candidatus Omnitrophota bacterium]
MKRRMFFKSISSLGIVVLLYGPSFAATSVKKEQMQENVQQKWEKTETESSTIIPDEETGTSAVNVNRKRPGKHVADDGEHGDGKVTKPTSAAGNMRPASPANSMRPASPAHSMRPASPANSMRPASPAHSMRPASPANEMRPASPAHSMRPASPANEMKRRSLEKR